jgi:type I restriction enzyme, S subunit
LCVSKQESLTNQQINSLIVNENNDHLFFYYYLKFLTPSLKKIAGGTTTHIINKTQFENFPISLPPLPEQHAIASVLSAFDDKIELLRGQNKILEEMGQVIFGEWFGKYGVEDELPEGWKIYSLGEVSKMTAGGDKPKNSSDYKTDKNIVPIYSNGISNDGLYGYTDSAKIYEESVTISARGTIGYVSLRQEPYVPIVRLVAIIPNTQYLSSKYLFLWLKNQNIAGTGTTQQQLTIPDFSKTRIIIPDQDIMIKFTILLDDLYRKISDNNSQIQSLAKTRDELLPKLMGGSLKLDLHDLPDEHDVDHDALDLHDDKKSSHQDNQGNHDSDNLPI